MKKTHVFDMENPAERASWLRITLRATGLTADDIAREIQVTPKFVADVINSRRSSLRVREHIAGKIKQPIDAIWPQQRRTIP